MYCTKCGKPIPEEYKHCPDCDMERNNREMPLYRVVFITGIASMACAVLALHVVIMGLGIILGAVSVYMFFRFRKETHESHYLKFALALAIAGILCNLGWLIAVNYFL